MDTHSFCLDFSRSLFHFCSLPLIPREEFVCKKNKLDLSRKLSDPSFKSYLYFTYLHPSALKQESDTIALQCTYQDQKSLWALYKIHKSKKTKSLFIHNWFVHLHPNPFSSLLSAETKEETNLFSISSWSQYRFLFSMITLLGWKHFLDTETIVSTEKVFLQEQKALILHSYLEKYETLTTFDYLPHSSFPTPTPPTSTSTLSTQPAYAGLIRKLSKYLKEFSGQSILPYCIECASLFCSHTTSRIQHKVIKKNKIRFYCFYYKLYPSGTDELIHLIQQDQTSSSVVMMDDSKEV